LRKGFAFERKVAKELSLALTDGADAYAVSRRSGSGGSKRDKEHWSGCSGDLQADKEEALGFFDANSVELKHYANLSNALWQLLASGSGKRAEFLKKAIKDAGGRNTVLIFKSDRIRALVITNDGFFSGGKNVFCSGKFVLAGWGIEQSLYLLSYDDFLLELRKGVRRCR